MLIAVIMQRLWDTVQEGGEESGGGEHDGGAQRRDDDGGPAVGPSVPSSCYYTPENADAVFRSSESRVPVHGG